MSGLFTKRTQRLRELSLFTGIGGGIFGSKLLGWQTVGYVEFDEYCQKVIQQRIQDGVFDKAPVFSDVREFVREGYAEKYRGYVDVISGGFPCQPYSQAGKKLAEKDERNMWPATAECVRIIKPTYCFFENVRGILSTDYFGEIVKTLSDIGYCVRWKILSAAEVGAPHKRDRIWIMADSNRTNGKTGHESSQSSDVGWGRLGNQDQEAVWWKDECGLDRLDHGSSDWGKRIKSIANAQVPLVAATAWNILSSINHKH